MSTLFIRGISDTNTAKIFPGPNGAPDLSFDGCCGVFWSMKFDPGSAEAITLFGDSFPNQNLSIQTRPTLIFNEISDPDSHQGALRTCELLCNKLQLPVINHPSRILQTTRDNVTHLLKDVAGLVVPETIRITPCSPNDIFTHAENARLAFPLIVRLAGTHGGESSTLITGRSDIDKLHRYAFNGSEFYLTEFVDYVSEDGLYRKYRIVVIDGVPLFRHHMIDRKWMIHASSKQFMEQNNLLLEESRALRNAFDEHTLPVIRPALDEISKRLALEYYGIDCHIDVSGKILIFEVNANMNILANNYAPLEEQMQRIRQHIRQLIEKHSGGKTGATLQQSSRQ